MKLEIKKVSIALDEREARELMGQINKVAGSMAIHTDFRNTAISRLYLLLEANFESQVAGIHIPKN